MITFQLPLYRLAFGEEVRDAYLMIKGYTQWNTPRATLFMIIGLFIILMVIVYIGHASMLFLITLVLYTCKHLNTYQRRIQGKRKTLLEDYKDLHGTDIMPQKLDIEGL